MDSTGPTLRSPVEVVNYVVVLAGVVVLLVFAKLIVVAVLVGVGAGAILAPRLKTMHLRLHIPIGAAAALVAIAGLMLLGAVGWGIASAVDAQAAQLTDRMPELVQRLQERSERLLSRYPWIRRNVASADLASSASAVGAAVFKGAWSGIGVFSALLFASVIGIYVAVDAPTYAAGFVRAFPASRRATVERFLRQAGETLRRWFHAQLIDMLIIGTLTSLGLWIVGIDYWLLLGVLTGVLGIIPYVGIAIVVCFAGLITLASDPSRLPWVFAVFLATQQLEGNVILPMVMRGSARLPAVPLLVFMLLMGIWSGLLGVLIAPPLFAILCLAYREFYLPRVDGVEHAAEEALGDPASPRVARQSPARDVQCEQKILGPHTRAIPGNHPL